VKVIKEIIFDIECDNLLNKATKVHVLSYTVVGEWKIRSIYEHKDIVDLFKQDAIFIGHFISNYDLAVLNKLVGVNVDFPYYDTLFLSHYLFPDRNEFSLESFGQDFGIDKVKIDDWNNLSIEDYTKRCETDVKINSNLYVRIKSRLEQLYDNDKESIDKLLKYMSFKASCAYQQIVNPCYIDIEKAQDLIILMAQKRDEKLDKLRQIMPKVKVLANKVKPKIIHKKDGSLSASGQDWFNFLQKAKLPETTSGPVVYVKSYKEPNPSSTSQIKDWLTSLGWVPATYKFVRNKETNAIKQVPQILKENKELCDSILVLLDKHPEISELKGLGVLNHRIAQVEGFIRDSVDGWLPQELVGITSTHRMKHAKIVNLPGVDKPWGNEIRDLFIAPKGDVVFGVDVVSSEAKTRDHFIKPYDPKYVEEMSSPDFDAHLDMAVRTGLLTSEQAALHKKGEANYGKERKVAKVINFSVLYKCGSTTLSRNTGFSEYECKKFIKAYWERNWAVLEVENNSEVKTMFNCNWIKNPVSGFWLELRNEKDKFSALNQNLSTYFMDNFIMYCQLLGLKIRFQLHDEVMFYCQKGGEAGVEKTLKKAAQMANQRLELNVTMSIDFKIGKTYAEVH
jgi:hypothetical protein